MRSLGHNLSLAVMAVVLYVPLVGCGGTDGQNLGTVQGTVTLGGEPLPNAQVVFQPANGRPSTAITNDQGKYELQYTSAEPGALTGSHQVTITTAIDLPDETRAAEKVPAKYNRQSDLVREVKAGKNTIDFELEK